VSTTPLDFYSTGKRKTCVARVHLRPGTGEFQLNDRGLDEFFGGWEALKQIVKQPFTVTETNDKFDVLAILHGGGVMAQAGALRHGISRALCVFNLELHQQPSPNPTSIGRLYTLAIGSRFATKRPSAPVAHTRRAD
jgi:ribosomal protein S9